MLVNLYDTTMKKHRGIFLLFMFLLGIINIRAQSAPDLEFATAQGTSNPTGNGPVSNTVINFVQNPDNPTGTTFQSYSPKLSATYSISNQVYTNAASIGADAGNSAAPIFVLMNAVGSPPNNAFTSSGAAAGTGMHTANNRTVRLLFNTSVLNGRPTNTTYQLADLTITFSRPVNNPIFHIGGFGGTTGSLGFTGGFSYVSSNVPVSFSRLSGNSNSFSVTSTSINNTAAAPVATGTSSGSGSVLVTGTGITTIVLRMSVRGDGNGSSWVATLSLLVFRPWRVIFQ